MVILRLATKLATRLLGGATAGSRILLSSMKPNRFSELATFLPIGFLVAVRDARVVRGAAKNLFGLG